MAESRHEQADCTVLSSLKTENENKSVCTVCQTEGETQSSVGYCKTCNQHLCKTCFKEHKETLQSEGHILLDKTKVPNQQFSAKYDNSCQLHNGKAVMYHCSKHSYFGCHDCNTEHSKNCQAMVYIPDISDESANSRKFKDTQKTMARIVSQTKSLSDGARRKKETIERCSRNAKAELDSYKLDLIQAIEYQVERLKETVTTTESTEKTKLEKMIMEYDAVQSKAEKMVKRIDSLKYQNNSIELYIALENTLCEVPELQYELSSGTKDQHTKSFKYEANHNTLESIKKPHSLGDIRSPDIGKVEQIETLKINVEDDKEICEVTGSTLMSEDLLVIADQSNKKVKLFDTASNRKVAYLELSSKPWTVAKIMNNSFVVTLPSEKKIVFVQTGNTLAIERELVVDGKCTGITYGNGLLVVSYFEQNKVELMDVDGRIVRIIQIGDKGQKLFNNPSYVAIRPIDNIIYVSNNGSNNVLCIDIEGNVLLEYWDIKFPRQAIINATGQVIITEQNPPVVRKLENDGTKSTPFLSDQNGLSAIGHVCYDEIKEKLFIAESKRSYIKVFRMQYS